MCRGGRGPWGPATFQLPTLGSWPSRPTHLRSAFRTITAIAHFDRALTFTPDERTPPVNPASHATTALGADLASTMAPSDELKVKFHPHWDEYFQEKKRDGLIPAYTGSPAVDSPREPFTPRAKPQRRTDWRLTMVYCVALLLLVSSRLGCQRARSGTNPHESHDCPPAVGQLLRHDIRGVPTAPRAQHAALC